MIFSRRFCTALLLLVCGAFATKDDSDDLQTSSMKTLTITENFRNPVDQSTLATVELSTEASTLPVVTDAFEPIEYEDANIPPRVDKRVPRTHVTAGKPFVIKVEENVFYDEEDKTNLKLELLDKNKQPIPSNSWIRFDPSKREIYGLPLDSDASRYEFKLRATDSAGESVEENIDITVQQYKGYRSVNHEIYIQVKLDKIYESPVEWEIRLIRGLVQALDDGSASSVVVKEIRPNKYDPNMFTFIYTNETLPKDHCPRDELEELMNRLTKPALNEAMKREIVVRNIEKDLVGTCRERVPPKTHIAPTNTKNFPPTVRNPVDQIKAFVGQLLVFEVPKDTFYDPEDFTELKLTLLNGDRSPLKPDHWLQFDAKKHEFYGVPTPHDKTQQYILVAEDKQGLLTNDALMVEVLQGNYKRDLGTLFDYHLDIPLEQFHNAATKRKFIEGVARVFQDADTSHILLKVVKKLQYVGRTSVIVQNKTLYRENRECPNSEIDKLRQVLLRQDRSVRDEVKTTIGNDFNVLSITVLPYGNCAGDVSHHPEEITTRPEEITRMKHKNFPPIVRNSIVQIKANVGQILVFQVPLDTFYDPEDFTELKLTLLDGDQSPLKPGHWLQFDAKRNELYGNPTPDDKSQQYILVAEDKQGLTASDAFMVEISVSPNGDARNLPLLSFPIPMKGSSAAPSVNQTMPTTYAQSISSGNASKATNATPDTFTRLSQLCKELNDVPDLNQVINDVADFVQRFRAAPDEIAKRIIVLNFLHKGINIQLPTPP